MDYFNFEDASDMPPLNLDDGHTTLDGEYTGLTTTADLQSCPAPVQPSTDGPMRLKLINDVEIEVVRHTTDVSADYPMFRAKEPCDLCARMGLDCFLASRGVLFTGCTCCISLYRECSFVHPKVPKGFVSTFPGIHEDEQVCEGSQTELRKAMKSMEEGRGRKTGARFPRDAVKILKTWLAEHSDHPYPNEREKDELKHLTGLKRSQISNWLANARRRGKARAIDSGPSSPILGAIDIPHSGHVQDIANLNPLDRWKASPPENEPASMTAIARAVTSTPLPARKDSLSSLHGSRASSRKSSSENDSAFSMFRAPSASSFETRESSNSDLTFASSRSNRSKGSFASSQDRRRRRRQPTTQRAVAQQSKAKSARIFQCTFCADSFPAKYDWMRHEKSLHLALERWTCCPEGATMTDKLTGIPVCVFCKQANPTDDHLESHNFNACQEKTQQERTFYRKDHLSQHLKLMHNSRLQPHMDKWKTVTTEIKSVCGFCPSQFTTWQQRADHLAAHFRNGATMKGWTQGWGFEPHIEKLVENAIPPYLIGYEITTMNPYVARIDQTDRSNSCCTDPGLTAASSSDEVEVVDRFTRDSNCWRRLEQALIKYLSRCKAEGFIPSDQQIQDHARLVIYEDTDPWNWTAADNEQWLSAFKHQQGIGPVGELAGAPPLAEVTIHAPYAVRGGRKNKVMAADCAQKRANGEPCPLRIRNSESMSASNSLPHQSGLPLANYDQNMEFDFDSIDFNNLDLGSMDDLNFDGLETTGGISSLSSSLPGDPAPGVDGYNFSLPLDMNLDSVGMPPQLLPQQMTRMEFLTEQDMNHLSGYTAGFK